MRLIDQETAIYAFGGMAANEVMTGEKEARLPHLEGKLPRFAHGYQTALEDAAAFLKRMPTIEAEPVKHGKWVPVYHQYHNKYETVMIADAWDCSLCDRRYGERTNYCPNCGATMDLEG